MSTDLAVLARNVESITAESASDILARGKTYAYDFLSGRGFSEVEQNHALARLAKAVELVCSLGARDTRAVIDLVYTLLPSRKAARNTSEMTLLTVFVERLIEASDETGWSQKRFVRETAILVHDRMISEKTVLEAFWGCVLGRDLTKKIDAVLDNLAGLCKEPQLGDHIPVFESVAKKVSESRIAVEDLLEQL